MFADISLHRRRRHRLVRLPAFDQVVATERANYADPVTFVPQRRYVPRFILPAVTAVP